MPEQPTNWPFVAAEGVRNALTSRATGLLLILLTALAVAGTGLADAVAVATLTRKETQWIASGGTVLVASSEAGVSAASCESMNQVPGIIGAASMTSTTIKVRANRAPGVPLSLTRATASMLRLTRSVAPTPIADPGTWVAAIGDETAASLGLSTGDHIVLAADDGATQTADIPTDVLQVTVVDTTILPEQLSAGVILLAPASGAGDCIIATTPSSTDTIAAALPALLAAGGQPVTVANRLIEGSFGHTLTTSFEARPTRWLPYAAGFAVGIAWTLIAWGRRSREGLYATLGFTRTHRYLINTTEWFILSGTGLGFGLTIAGIVATFAEPHLTSTPPSLARAGLVTWLTATAITLVITATSPRSIPNALKDR